MLLYILVRTEPFEGDEMLGVYDSKEAAINAARVYYRAEANSFNCPLLSIGEYTLNNKATDSINIEWSDFNDYIRSLI